MTTISLHTYKDLLNKTTQCLRSAGIHSARLDAEILLAHVLCVERTWLVVHSDEELESKQAKAFERLVKRRLAREPVSYLVGHKEFYGREFIVTPDVLTPRPETESLINLFLELGSKKESTQNIKPRTRVLDVGCGSGCIGITLKMEQPELDVTLCDIDPKALQIATKNAKTLGAEVTFVQSDLLGTYTNVRRPASSVHFDFILANLPYVDHAWERSPETDHEPALALFAEDNGLELIKKLMRQSTNILTPNGYLLLEADPEQHARIIAFAKNLGLSHAKTQDYAIALRVN